MRAPKVLTLLPNLDASFKISSPLEWMGTITEDRSTSIYGELGRKADTVPLSITLKDGRRAPLAYHMQMVQDRVLSPFIMQMAVYSAIDATERTLGMGSYSLRGAVEFVNGAASLEARQLICGRFQRAGAGLDRRGIAPVVDHGRGLRRAQDQGHQSGDRGFGAQARYCRSTKSRRRAKKCIRAIQSI